MVTKQKFYLQKVKITEKKKNPLNMNSKCLASSNRVFWNKSNQKLCVDPGEYPSCHESDMSENKNTDAGIYLHHTS